MSTTPEEVSTVSADNDRSSNDELADLSRAELEERVRDLESRLSTLEDALTIPGEDTDRLEMEALEVNGLPIGAAIKSKAAKRDVEELVYQIVEDLVDSDTSVRTGVDRDALLPVHSMWYDLQAGRRDNIPNDAARRAARIFNQLFRRAAGDAEPKVTVTDQYYVMDSGQVKDVLRAADDITDGGVSKTARRAMEAVQRFTKVTDCDCKDIEVCDHGLVIFDGSGGTNKLRAEKGKLNAYGSNVEQAISADDDGEQPSEAATPADVDDSTEAADAEIEQLLNADAVTDEVSDTVVSNLDAKASESPIVPDR